MFLFKIIALSLTGTAGVLGSASPFIHIGVTKSNWKTRWYKRLEGFSEPILKDCRPEESNGKLYNVFLEENTQTSDSTKVLLRVEETTINSGIKQIVWKSENETVQGEGNWDKWKLARKDNVLDLSYPKKNPWYSTIEYLSTNCSKRKIMPALGSTGFGSGVPLESNQVQLTISEDSQCRKYFSSVECDVTINVSDKLKWIDGQQPKVIYTAF